MILIIGGRCSGKLEYVKSLGYGDKDISVDVYGSEPVLYHLECIKFPADEEKILLKEVVVCDEVGSGIVPIDNESIMRREEISALTTRLATCAQSVVRIVAGIAVKLK